MTEPDPSSQDIARDFHHHDPSLLADPWPIYHRFQDECPVARSERYGGFWILSRYADVLAAARDTATFSSAKGVAIPEMGLGMPLLPFEVDPPRHTAYRHLLMRDFSPSAVADLKPYALLQADRLLDEVAEGGRCDLIDDYALPLTSAVFGQLLTLPSRDRAMITHWTNQIMERVSDPSSAAAAITELMAYLDELISLRRNDPRSDVLGVLLEAEIGGKPLTHEEVLGLCFTFVLAGLETTIVAIGTGLQYLAQHPGVRSRLIADPGLLQSGIEELFRLEPPAQGHARTLTRDCEIDGQKMREGERLLLLWAAANRDPAEFESPDEFVVDRHPNRHFTFGAGPHRCIGSHLARMEVEVAVGRMLQRFPQYRIVDESEIVTFKPARGPRTLPVVLDG